MYLFLDTYVFQNGGVFRQFSLPFDFRLLPLTVWVNNVTIIKDLDAFAGFPFIQQKNGESGIKMNF